ncbi:hypothetical protein [Nocardia donostiensis]|uniref:Uncharacterized protein n=1 Tax=Nocardia donostiensis TaxID=1538463 RepID=A0A1V2TID2_9NOCA|nr:hypothetical protein [Nocardia donostiensis]ONM49254.1 hypothetical protein B0T46_07625 [Nocardia donostiensis]OQS14775.1 hypothetical protein B0T36_11885 [Nocardia donostiensis]OQS21778.1 hypothetical protein B0T44_06580 [Nocardia donostiensis]
MPMAASESIARQQLYRYFLDTLRMLPVELSLSVHNAAVPTAAFDVGTTLPCDDSDDGRTGPLYFDISYWLIGTTPASSDAVIDLVVGAWAALGWRTRTGRTTRPRSAFCRTPDYYGLAVQQSVDGHLSLSGSTPPFPPDTAGGAPLPRTIEHP